MNKTEVQNGCSLSLYHRHKIQKGRVLNSALGPVPTYQVDQYFLNPQFYFADWPSFYTYPIQSVIALQR